jgi:uncharacterized protein
VLANHHSREYDSFVDQTPEAISTISAPPVRRFRGYASPFLHHLLLFGDRFSRWGPAALSIYIGALTLMVIAVWSYAIDSINFGVVAGLGFLSFALVDWLMLAQLPRRHRSFGPIGPGLIAFTFIRAVFTILAALIDISPWWTATLVQISNLALTGYVMDTLWGEPFRLGVTRLTLKSSKLNGAPPLRILHFSDLHIERSTIREKKLLKLIDELRPDVIVYTGDLLNFSYLTDVQARSDCQAILKQIQAPLGVYAIPGTPLIDSPEVLKSIYTGLDHIQLLINETQVIEGYPLVQLIGLGCTHDRSLDAPQLDRLRPEVPPEKFSLLLYHSPDLMPEAIEANIDLYLCGHTHGGQVRLPIIGAILTGSIYRKRYEMGRYVQNHTTLYVSRGIGLEGKGAPRMRFLCPPEIELIELRGET